MRFMFLIFWVELVCLTKPSSRQLVQWLELMEEVEVETGNIPGESSAGV